MLLMLYRNPITTFTSNQLKSLQRFCTGSVPVNMLIPFVVASDSCPNVDGMTPKQVVEYYGSMNERMLSRQLDMEEMRLELYRVT